MSNHRALSPRQLTEQKCCLCSVHGCVTCWRCAAGQPSFFFFLSSRSFYELQSVTLLRKWRSKSSLIVQGSNSFNSRRCHVHKRSIWHVYVHVWLICFVTEEVFGTNGAIASPRSLFKSGSLLNVLFVLEPPPLLLCDYWQIWDWWKAGCEMIMFAWWWEQEEMCTRMPLYLSSTGGLWLPLGMMQKTTEVSCKPNFI